MFGLCLLEKNQNCLTSAFITISRPCIFLACFSQYGHLQMRIGSFIWFLKVGEFSNTLPENFATVTNTTFPSSSQCNV